MAAVTLYRFRLELSDVDRGVYETLDFRLAMHPSETSAFLLTRVLAYALNFGEGLEFAPGGLSDPDAPALSRASLNGGVDLWIEIGNPNARKLHKAAKASRETKVYTYKNIEPLLRDLAGASVHRADEIEIYSLDSRFLDELETILERDNRWSVLHTDGALVVSSGARTASGDLRRHAIK